MVTIHNKSFFGSKILLFSQYDTSYSNDKIQFGNVNFFTPHRIVTIL